MAYTDDGVKAKLSALNETQEGILWMQRIKDSSSGKRLNLIYLANEVIQQSKARKKDEFARGFSPIIAEATAVAYKGATNDIQQKLRRVIEVWRQRQIFEQSVQEDVERRVNEIDRTRSTNKKPTLGGSLFSSTSSLPAELQSLVSLQTALTKAEIAVKSSSTNANTEYNKLADPTASVPTPPVHAARLSALLKTLATAEGAVAESIKARQGLIEGLTKILESNKSALLADEEELTELKKRRTSTESRKSEVEDSIMRGLADESSSVNITTIASTGLKEPPRPEIEALTPPPVESITPVGTPPPVFGLNEETATSGVMAADFKLLPTNESVSNDAELSDLKNSGHRNIPLRDDNINGGSLPPMKKRKINVQAGEDFADFGNGNAMEGLDDDVAAMLGA